jgi:hypothetical protein
MNQVKNPAKLENNRCFCGFGRDISINWLKRLIIRKLLRKAQKIAQSFEALPSAC